MHLEDYLTGRDIQAVLQCSGTLVSLSLKKPKVLKQIEYHRSLEVTYYGIL